MIPGALGTALMLAGVLAGLSAAFGRHSPAAVIAIGVGAAFAALGGLLIAWFAASVAAGRIPCDDGGDGLIDEADIELMIRNWREANHD